MKNRNLPRRCFFLIGTALIVLACGMLFYNYNESKQAETHVENILTQFHEVLKEQENMPILSKMEQQVYIPDYILNPDMEMPTIEIEGNTYIGVLCFPSLDMELPVMSSWSYPDLKVAPCLYAGSMYSNNAVIAAHNYTSHFGRLTELVSGDLVVFMDIDGNGFTYEVVVQEVIDPVNVEEMISSGFSLSLFTCTPGGAARFTTRCKLLPDA